VFSAMKGWFNGECGVMPDGYCAWRSGFVSGPGSDYSVGSKSAQYYGLCSVRKECCKTLHIRAERTTLVLHQIDTRNNRPVYKHTRGKEEFCIHYEKQWMGTNCKTGNSEKVEMVSKANVDCPDQIDAGEWYHPIRPDWDDIRALSFSCGSKLRECCQYIRYEKGVLEQYGTFNNRPVYTDKDKKYCMFYHRKQWMVVVDCNLFFVNDWWKNMNNNKGVVLLSKANVDCPDQIVGDMYWYTPDGIKTDVSYPCDMLSTTTAMPTKPIKPVKPAKKLLSKSFGNVLPFGGF